jgi:hypothetical protein|tara:strand:- start:115 stop:441 length:327 start_codon:yes stop_codon:yes gene_type:complete
MNKICLGFTMLLLSGCVSPDSLLGAQVDMSKKEIISFKGQNFLIIPLKSSADSYMVLGTQPEGNGLIRPATPNDYSNNIDALALFTGCNVNYGSITHRGISTFASVDC